MASQRMHLSKARINALPNPDRPLTVHDDAIGGFELLALPSGTKTFYMHGRTREGRQYRLKLGRFETELSPERARAEAKRIRAAVALGHDPAAERRAKRRANKERQAAPTVDQLWAAFSEARKGAWSPNTAQSYELWFRKHVAPAIGHQKAHEVQPGDVRRMYRSISKPATKEQALRVVSSMYSWATAQDDLALIASNPCAGALARADKGPGAAQRERYPVNGELERLVNVLATRDDLAARFFLLLLLTGCRKGELLHAKWTDFDLGSATWIKPATATKQKKLHRLPLNPEAVAVLREIKEVLPFAPFAKLTKNNLWPHWRKVCKAAGIENLRLHDLRHWHASLAASGGESLLTIGGLLGHRSQATSARYSHLVDESLRAASRKVGEVVRLVGRRS